MTSTSTAPIYLIRDGASFTPVKDLWVTMPVSDWEDQKQTEQVLTQGLGTASTEVESSNTTAIVLGALAGALGVALVIALVTK